MFSRLLAIDFILYRYNNKENRKTMDPPSVKFAHIGYRATPKLGSAIMWPNVDFDNIYQQNPGTVHAADELHRGTLIAEL